MKILRYSINGLRLFPWAWAFFGAFAGVTLAIALLGIGFLALLGFGVHTVILGGVLGTVLGVLKGISMQRKRGLRSLINTADRPFY